MLFPMFFVYSKTVFFFVDMKITLAYDCFMRKYELIAPCHFGLESVLKREIIDLGYDVSLVEDGKVSFLADEEGVCRANIGLRTAERILIKIGSFKATTFDELFVETSKLPWEEYIPVNGRFNVVKAAGIKSALFSPSDIQSIMKKAMVERLKKVYNVSWFAEDGEDYPVRVTIMKDIVTVGLDTTGISLHKRGYRKLTAKAPIAENLAAALIMLTPWKAERVFADPFCGSGTFPIEAAMMAANMAPGMNRKFNAMNWNDIVNRKVWKDAFDEAFDCVDKSVKTRIYGSDIDTEMIEVSKANARLAGVDKLIDFKICDAGRFTNDNEYGFIVTNPPYGERLEDKESLMSLYSMLGRQYKALDNWSMFIISSYEKVEDAIGRKADKNRKIYNGMLKTYFYSFMGKKPGRQ